MTPPTIPTGVQRYQDPGESPTPNGRSRRTYKQSRSKVKVGLPRKNPRVFKPALNLPPKLRSLLEETHSKWDDQASVIIKNYKSFGVVSNPNFLGARSLTSHIVESDSLQVPAPQLSDQTADEFCTIDSGSDLEEDDLKTALGKKRRDGKSSRSKPLTNTQRVQIGRLIEKYEDDDQATFMDTKPNAAFSCNAGVFVQEISHV